MPKSQSSKGCNFWDILRPILKFLISPPWCIVESCSYYTHIFPFLLVNHAFFHCFIYPILFFMIIFLPPNLEKPCPEYNNLLFMLMAFFSHGFPMVHEINWIQKFFKPKVRVQKMEHIVVGLFGMIFSVWTMIGCTICWSLEIMMNASAGIFLISLCFLIFSYTMFCSSNTRLYVRLPAKNKPFNGLKIKVVLFAIFHLAVGIAAFWLTKNFLIYILLLTSSFIFCVNAYSCFFTDTYMLCEHRKNRYKMRTQKPALGVVYNVVVRENSKMTDLPDGFQFSDELKVDERWYEKYWILE